MILTTLEASSPSRFKSLLFSQLLKLSKGVFKIAVNIRKSKGWNCKIGPKLYIPSTLSIDLILWHTQLIVCALKWFKSWVISFTFHAYTLPHTPSLKFHNRTDINRYTIILLHHETYSKWFLDCWCGKSNLWFNFKVVRSGHAVYYKRIKQNKWTAI